MTSAVRDSFSRDENGTISDHLRNHVHLTNCIHLKNHMHRQSPILAERSLMRDLIMLQRSRSLRDPSTSPPSWHSPSVVDSLARKLEKDGAISGRRSVGADCRKEVGKLSRSSSPAGGIAASKVAAAEVIGEKNSAVGISNGVIADRARDVRRAKGEETKKKGQNTDHSVGSEKPFQDRQDLSRTNALVIREAADRKVSRKGDRVQTSYLKTLSERLQEHPLDSQDVESFRIHQNGRHRRVDDHETREAREPSIHGYCNGPNRLKRRKFHGMRRTGVSIGSREVGGHNECSVASNTLAQGSGRPKHSVKEAQEEDAELEVARGPSNGCGIPWNWSRIHHRGKTILDKAGRSLSCGLSDSRFKRGEGSAPQSRRDASDMPLTSDHSSSSAKSDSEALPLLIEPSGSQENSENAVWLHEFSGELGIFANHSLRHDLDSELPSEARSGSHHSKGRQNGRHQSLTQRYMPKTFKDLVGQNLVVQALSNAVLRRKVGLLYVFYGPNGTGKTSCARIFARALNCRSLEDPKPCGVCNSCIAHDLGKSQNVHELGPVGNYDFDSIMDILDGMVSPLPSQYRVFIIDDCDTLPPDSWSFISKVIDLAPRRVVFVLISSTLDHLPHIIISRCQKFFFPKLKDADIIYALQWIATKEGVDIDKDALKLIASRSDGSLRDAEMTLDQLSLLGQRISVPLVQELVGLISDEKLVDLLDLALSADTVNTVKNLREIMEAGVEPLPLMSQLATIITDILAGTYVFTRERLRRKFFRKTALSKEDTEKLRQALKTLSEAEKQLRVSNDRLTWLTAALLQLAPDQQYVLLSSSADTSFNHSPAALNNNGERHLTRKYNGEHADLVNNRRFLPSSSGTDHVNSGNAGTHYTGGKKHSIRSQTSRLSTDIPRTNGGQFPGKGRRGIEEIWFAVLEKIQLNVLRQFMHQEGQLVSVSFGAAPTAQLIFTSHLNKSKAEKFRGQILQAFESVLGSPVTIEIRCEYRQDVGPEVQVRRVSPASEDGRSDKKITNESLASDKKMKMRTENHTRRLSKDKVVKGDLNTQPRHMPSGSHEFARSEIVELAVSPQEQRFSERMGNGPQLEKESFWVEEPTSSHHYSASASHLVRTQIGEKPARHSLVRSKVSLAHVIQQAEGCSRRNGWSRRKAISIAEKLEQENLRLEPKSRNLLCWKSSRISRGKVPHFKIKPRKPCSFLKLISCEKCLRANSPSSSGMN